MSFRATPSALRHPFSSTQLTANVQAVAGIVSLLNDFLISKRKPPLGFLNPWLYGDGLVGLNDVIKGSNPGCNTRGFNATQGWDPVCPSLHFRLWLILCSVGHGSGDPGIQKAARRHSGAVENRLTLVTAKSVGWERSSG